MEKESSDLHSYIIVYNCHNRVRGCRYKEKFTDNTFAT